MIIAGVMSHVGALDAVLGGSGVFFKRLIVLIKTTGHLSQND